MVLDVREIKSGSFEEIIDQMIDILEEEGCVTDRALLRSDIIAREEQGSTMLRDKVYAPHAKTEGVDRFCYVVCRTDEDETFVLCAWKTNSAVTLNKLGYVLESVINPEMAA